MKQRDRSQGEVIGISKGRHLVLAPPGCGKTDLLAERIRLALAAGVDPAGMLCLTFTNRAARGMLSRIRETVGRDCSGLYVGNIHRFCARFLFDNGHLPMSAAILDELDVQGILLHLDDKDEEQAAMLGFEDRERYGRVARIAHYIYQLRHGHEILLHGIDPRIEELCSLQGRKPEDLLEILPDMGAVDRTVIPDTGIAEDLELATRYNQYKKDYLALDFDDLLLFAYTIMSKPGQEYHRYPWVQVDEVQDLSPLQLKICDLLARPGEDSCIVYLGDEQQAIFSFMGASLGQLEELKRRCGGKALRLENNYRSPSYLLEICNIFANLVLDSDPDLLPRAVRQERPQPKDLRIIGCDTKEQEAQAATVLCSKLLALPPRHGQDAQRVALLVPTNKDAEALSEQLNEAGFPHFKLSGQDAFSSRAMQLVISHLWAFTQGSSLIAWSRIFRELRIFSGKNQYAKSRAFIRSMQEVMLSPADLLGDGHESRLKTFLRLYSGEVVLFDTETTGLDTMHDDIVQISAIKAQGGRIVDRLNVFMETGKEIPTTLGDLENPLRAAYADPATPKLPRDEGLKQFMAFIEGTGALIAHNASFDLGILAHNLARDLGVKDFPARCPPCLDSIVLATLVRPRLRSYRLSHLISALSLQGQNSHLADDDVTATLSLVDFCAREFSKIQEKQARFISDNRGPIDLFRAKYQGAWQHTLGLLGSPSAEGPAASALANEANWLYQHFLGLRIIKPCDKIEHILRFIDQEVARPADEPTLRDQILAHATELGTYKEADLCESGVVREKIFVSTVHKAKGLEFENVVVLDAIEDVYPFFKSKDDPDLIMEDARKFYVAISRAKIRLAIMVPRHKTGVSRRGPYSFDTQPSRFLRPISGRFVRIDLRTS